MRDPRRARNRLEAIASDRSAAEDSGALSGSAEAPRGKAKRVRFGTLPTPSSVVEVPYAKRRPELQGMSYGEMTHLVLQSNSWREIMDPILDELDRQRCSRGPGRGYTARECEAVLVFQWATQESSIKKARDALAGDRGAEGRRLLGLDRDRGFRPTRGRPENFLRAGIPSESSICRHKARFGMKRRKKVWDQVIAGLREEIAPLLGDEARILYIDGTKIETHFTPPKTTTKDSGRQKKWRKVVNKELVRNRYGRLVSPITAPDAGYVGQQGAPPEKSGAGWSLIPLLTEDGIPLAHRIVPLQKSETIIARRVINEFNEKIRPHLSEPNAVRVASTDTAYLGEGTRRAWRKAGIIENTHFASHAIRDGQPSGHSQKLDRDRYKLDGYPNYYADGHRAIHCSCGQASFASRSSVDRQGVAQTRIEGSCANCGPITIISGRWRQVRNVRGRSPEGRRWTGGFVRCVRPEDFAQAELALGNVLTYHDSKATLYGSRRFGHNEGFNGQLSTRFGLNEGKRWYRYRAQAETDANIVCSLMIVLAMEQKRRARTAEAEADVEALPLRSGEPPPLQEAA